MLASHSKEQTPGMAKAIIFDIDGTLVDSVDLHAKAWQEALQHFGHDIPFNDIRSQIGKGGDQLLPVFLSQEELKQRGKEIENYRGAESGALLRQLVRRGLIQIAQRIEAGVKEVTYSTTSRFLEVFGLQNLDDLPRTRDLQQL